MDNIKKGIKFKDGSSLVFNCGKKDQWCVWYMDEYGHREAVWDGNLFWFLKEHMKKFDAEKIYNDFNAIFGVTKNYLDESIFGVIENMCESYGSMKDRFFKVFSSLYMEMIAEENAPYHPLGKRVKRLAVYRILFDGISWEWGAQFLKNKNCHIIEKWCNDRNI